MGKRKSRSDDLPSRIDLQPASDPSTSGRTGPFVVYFANGFQPGKHGACSWEVHNSRERRNDHTLVARVDPVDLVGNTRSKEAAGRPSCKYAVGVLDKRTGELRYAEVCGGGIVRMEPRARGVNYGPTGITTEQATTVQDRILQNKRLVAAFGSTRRKRQLDQKEDAKVGDDNVTAQAAVEDLLAAAGGKAADAKMTKDDVLKAVTNIRHIPPHDPEATSAAEAYRLEDLVPADAWVYLETGRLHRASRDSAYRDEVLRANGLFPEFVLDRLAFPVRPAVAERRLRALAFLGALMQLYTGGHRLKVDPQRGGIRQLCTRMHVQEDVLRACLEQFYSRSEGDQEGVEVYSRSKEQHRALLLHALITALIAEDFEMGSRVFEALRSALKLAPQDMVTYYKEMGCVCEKAKGMESPLKQYRVMLLPPGSGAQPPKKLADAFPKLALARAKRK